MSRLSFSPRQIGTVLIVTLLAILLLFDVGGSRRLALRAVDGLLDLVRQPTPRELYLRNAKREGLISLALLEEWEAVYQRATNRQLFVPLPYLEVGGNAMDPSISARAFRFYLPAGRQLEVSVEQLQTKGLVFGELYFLESPSAAPKFRAEAAWEGANPTLRYEAADIAGEHLLLLLQTEPLADLSYSVRLSTEPSLAFPVAGVDSRAIGSVWGDPRDGGARQHEGNDIFAPKGTELLAVTDAYVSRVKEGGIGGKVIWLDDEEGREFRYYYAHLDDWRVEEGDFVQRGEVIGTVGNTGNARTTPPHLHFGVYRRKAVDPNPFIREEDKLPKQPTGTNNWGESFTPRRATQLLRSPKRDGESILSIPIDAMLRRIGTTATYDRVITEEGIVGFLRR